VRYDPQKHHRRSIRLKGYDYTQTGAYFITVVTHSRECLFGAIVDEVMHLNVAGEIARACWDDLPNHYPHIELDTFVVMPNHVHGIIVLTDNAGGMVGASLKLAPTERAPTERAPTEHTPATTAKRHGLPEIVRAFKTFSARRINDMRNTPGVPVWQRNYYERIVRDATELNRIRQYVIDNPKRWAIDREKDL